MHGTARGKVGKLKSTEIPGFPATPHLIMRFPPATDAFLIYLL